MAGAATFGITRSIYSLQAAQMHRHVVPLCRPVNLVPLMNIDHAHPDTFLRATNKNSGASEWHPGNCSFGIWNFTDLFIFAQTNLIKTNKMYVRISYQGIYINNKFVLVRDGGSHIEYQQLRSRDRHSSLSQRLLWPMISYQP